jgi:hypothetical protein
VIPAHSGSPGAFVFVAGKARDFVTGTSIPVDGGYSVQV